MHPSVFQQFAHLIDDDSDSDPEDFELVDHVHAPQPVKPKHVVARRSKNRRKPPPPPVCTAPPTTSSWFDVVSNTIGSMFSTTTNTVSSSSSPAKMDSTPSPNDGSPRLWKDIVDDFVEIKQMAAQQYSSMVGLFDLHASSPSSMVTHRPIRKNLPACAAIAKRGRAKHRSMRASSTAQVATSDTSSLEDIAVMKPDFTAQPSRKDIQFRQKRRKDLLGKFPKGGPKSQHWNRRQHYLVKMGGNRYNSHQIA